MQVACSIAGNVLRLVGLFDDSGTIYSNKEDKGIGAGRAFNSDY